MSVHSLTSEAGIGSRSHDLVGEEFRILRISPSDIGLQEDSVLLLCLGLVRDTGTDDCSATLIFIILSLKKMSKRVG